MKTFCVTACLFFLWLCSICSGQVLTVRLIDITNGHPLPKQQVTVSMGYEKGEKTPSNHPPITFLETDDEGKAQLRFSTPQPSYLYLFITFIVGYWPVDLRLTLKPEEVFQKGFVKKPGPKLNDDKIPDMVPKAVPGEVIILFRPSSQVVGEEGGIGFLWYWRSTGGLRG